MSDSQRTDGAQGESKLPPPWKCVRCEFCKKDWAYDDRERFGQDRPHCPECEAKLNAIHPPAPPLSIEGREEFEIYERIRTQVCANCGNDKSAHTPYPAKKPDKMKPLGIEPIAWICPEHACSSRLRNFKMLNHDQVEAFINFLLASRASDRERVNKYEVALKKIDAIRNSIVGFQQINWSEHIYPLVAALDEAGFEGAGYEVSAKNVGTLLERTTAAESRVAELQRELEDARVVILEESGTEREFTKDKSLAQWVHEFGLDREAEGIESAKARLSELTGLLKRALALRPFRHSATDAGLEEAIETALRSHLESSQ